MKFKKVLITSAALLGMAGLSGVTANAQQTNQQAANKILSTERNAYNNGEISKHDLDANVNNPELEADAHGYNSNNNSASSQTSNAASSHSASGIQYTGKILPQTGEASINPLALAAILSMTGIGLAVLSLLYKRNYANATTDDLSMNIKSKCNNLFKNILTNNIK